MLVGVRRPPSRTSTPKDNRAIHSDARADCVIIAPRETESARRGDDLQPTFRSCRDRRGGWPANRVAEGSSRIHDDGTIKAPVYTFEPQFDHCDEFTKIARGHGSTTDRGRGKSDSIASGGHCAHVRIRHRLTSHDIANIQPLFTTSAKPTWNVHIPHSKNQIVEDAMCPMWKIFREAMHAHEAGTQHTSTGTSRRRQ